MAAWIDIQVAPKRITFQVDIKDQVGQKARVVCEGNWALTRDGCLSGVCTRFEVSRDDCREPILVPLDLGERRPFDLKFTLAGKNLVVTGFQGGIWDGQSGETFRGTYQRGEVASRQHAERLAPAGFMNPHEFPEFSLTAR